eukprot:4153004-Pyramimonas_sp.AAC.1
MNIPTAVFSSRRTNRMREGARKELGIFSYAGPIERGKELGIFSRGTNRTTHLALKLEATTRLCCRRWSFGRNLNPSDGTKLLLGPAVCRNACGSQSYTGSAGIFSRRTNHTHEPGAGIRAKGDEPNDLSANRECLCRPTAYILTTD